MADTYTSTLGAILMGIGGDNNTWGTNLNNSVIQILEDAIANALTESVTGGTLDLSGTPPPAGPSQVRFETLIFTGTLASNQIVKVPNLIKKWRVANNCTLGSFTLSIQTPSGSPVVIPSGAGEVRCDGSNNITVSPYWSTGPQAPNGSAGAPSYSFASELASGWYRAGTNDIRLAIAGADVLQVTGAGATSPSVVNILSPNTLEINGSGFGGFTTGDVKLTIKQSADPGWLMMDDSTIGSASSNATHAGSQFQALFSVVWQLPAAFLTVYTSAGVPTTFGANAAADFAANKQLTLPKVLGRALAVAGSGAGLSARQIAQFIGEETHQLSTGEIPAHAHDYSGTTSNESQFHDHVPNGAGGRFLTTGNQDGIFATVQTASPGLGLPTTAATGNESVPHAHNFSGTTDNGTGGGGAHNNMQPTTFLNVMIKL